MSYENQANYYWNDIKLEIYANYFVLCIKKLIFRQIVPQTNIICDPNNIIRHIQFLIITNIFWKTNFQLVPESWKLHQSTFIL